MENDPFDGYFGRNVHSPNFRGAVDYGTVVSVNMGRFTVENFTSHVTGIQSTQYSIDAGLISFAIDPDTGRVLSVEANKSFANSINLSIDTNAVAEVTVAPQTNPSIGIKGVVDLGLVFSEVAKTVNSVFTVVDSWISNNIEAGVPAHNLCFAPGTPILLADGRQLPIEEIDCGTKVASFRQFGTGDSSAVHAPKEARPVSDLLTNVTSEWITLAWKDSAGGTLRRLTATPGHEMLTPHGDFKKLIAMIDGSTVPLHSQAIETVDGSEHYTALGHAELVLEDGSVARAEAHLVRYSAATAHLFEEAEVLVTRTEGGLAVEPHWKKGWKTYNFEVADYHTYIAGGVRVHNASTLAQALYPGKPFLGSNYAAAIAVWSGTDGTAYTDLGVINHDEATGRTYVTNWSGIRTTFHQNQTQTIARVFSRDDAGLSISISSFADAVAIGGLSFASGLAWSGSFIGVPYDASNGLSITANPDGSVDVDNPVTGVTTTNHANGTISISPYDADDAGSPGESGDKPIIIDLDGDGIEVAKLDDNFALFDLDDDGFLERTAWVGTDDGLLMFDENSDGQITSAREIAFAQWVEDGGVTDLEALAQLFDLNGDGKLDALDAQLQAGDALVDNGQLAAGTDIWENFHVWHDADGDAEIDEGELHTLADMGITEIGLTYAYDEQVLLDDGTFISGFIDVVRTNDQGVSETILGADVTFAWNPYGVKITEGANGVTSYEFETGPDEHVLTIDATLAAGDADNNVHMGTDVEDGYEAATQADVELTDINLVSVTGNDHANVIDGSGRTVDVAIAGEGGDDVLSGGAGHDVIAGGDGDDTISAGDGDDIIDGGLGTDILKAGRGHDIIIADADDFAAMNAAVEAYVAPDLVWNQVSITNGDFEEALLGEGGSTGSANGWSFAGSGGSFDPSDAQLPTDGVTSDDNNALYLNSGEVSQTLTETFDSGKQYKLGFRHGNRLETDGASLTLLVYAGTTLIGQLESDGPVSGRWEDHELLIDGSHFAEAGIDGDTIEVRFAFGEGGQALIDDVTLEAAAIIDHVTGDDFIDGGDGFDALFIEDPEGEEGQAPPTPGDIEITLADHSIEHIQSGSGDDTIRVYELDDNIFIDPTTGELYELRENVDGSFEYVHVAHYNIYKVPTNGEDYRHPSHDTWDTDVTTETDIEDYVSDELGNVTDALGNTQTYEWLIDDSPVEIVANDSDDGGEAQTVFRSFTLLGGAGDDFIAGSPGADRIVGETGNDTLEGDFGNDVYYFKLGDGGDIIRDFGSIPEVEEIEHTLNVTVHNDELITVVTAETTQEYVETTTTIEEQPYITLDITAGAGFGGIDTLFLANDIDWSDLSFERSWANGLQNLVMTINGEQVDADGNTVAVTDTITIAGQGTVEYNVEILTFANGMTLDLSNVMHTLDWTSDTTLPSSLPGDVSLTVDLPTGAATPASGQDALVAEDAEADTVVVSLSATGPAGETDYQFAIFDDPSGLFDVDGSDLVIAAGQSLDYEFAQSHDITLLVTASDGTQYLHTVTIGVSDVADGEVAPTTITGTAVLGDNRNNFLIGEAADETLVAYDGADFIEGGGGNDRLEGGGGDDSYYYALGDGDDVIHDIGRDFENNVEIEADGGVDAIYFGKNIAFGDLAFEVDPNDSDNLLIKVSQTESVDTGTTDADNNPIFQDQTTLHGIITVEDYFTTNGRVEWIVFDDGSVLHLTSILGEALGTSAADTVTWTDTAIYIDAEDGDDTITTGEHDDLLSGGLGTDRLEGGDGNDRYVYEREDGDDVIADTSGIDALFFGEGIAQSDVDYTLVNQGDGTTSLVITISETIDDVTSETGTVTVEDVLAGDSGIEWFSFADGTSVSFASILGDMNTTDNADTLSWTATAIDVDGGLGNDHLASGEYDDVLSGGEGNDILEGGAGDDVYVFELGDGTDLVIDEVSHEEPIYEEVTSEVWVSTGEGGYWQTVTETVQTGTQTIYQEAGESDALVFGENITLADVSVVRSGDDLVFSVLDENGAVTNDQVTLRNWMVPEAQVEWVQFGDGLAVELSAFGSILEGTAAADTLTATDVTLPGPDDEDQTHPSGEFILAGAGDDTIHTANGSEFVLAGDGDDVIHASEGPDLIDGGNGIDLVTYATANEGVSIDLNGGTGFGSHAQGDILSSVENLVGSTHDDLLIGNEADNDLDGLAGDDVLLGEDGDDNLDGGDGNDSLIGHAGNDQLTGGLGDDYLQGGFGDDILTGDDGADTFVFGGRGFGNDIITDFQDGIDRLDSSGAGLTFDDFTVQQDGADTLLIYTDEDNTDHTIRLSDITVSSIEASDFITV